MEVNDIVKLIVATGLTLSVVGISIQIMRLIGSLADNIKDLRQTVQNFGAITEGFVKEQAMIDSMLENVGSIIESIKDMINDMRVNVVNPAVKALGFIKSASSIVDNIKSRFKK